MCHLQLTIDGTRKLPAAPLGIDFEKPRKVEAYIYTMENLGKDFLRDKMPLSIDEWEKAYYINVFKLSMSSDTARAKSEEGTLRLEMWWSEELTGTKKLLLLFEMEQYLVLDNQNAYIEN